MDGWMDGSMVGQIDGWTDILVNGVMVRGVDGRADEWTDRRMEQYTTMMMIMRKSCLDVKPNGCSSMS